MNLLTPSPWLFNSFGGGDVEVATRFQLSEGVTAVTDHVLGSSTPSRGNERRAGDGSTGRRRGKVDANAAPTRPGEPIAATRDRRHRRRRDRTTRQRLRREHAARGARRRRRNARTRTEGDGKLERRRRGDARDGASTSERGRERARRGAKGEGEETARERSGSNYARGGEETRPAGAARARGVPPRVADGVFTPPAPGVDADCVHPPVADRIVREEAAVGRRRGREQTLAGPEPGRGGRAETDVETDGRARLGWRRVGRAAVEVAAAGEVLPRGFPRGRAARRSSPRRATR